MDLTAFSADPASAETETAAAARRAQSGRFWSWLRFIVRVDAGCLGSPEADVLLDFDLAERPPGSVYGNCHKAVTAWRAIEAAYRGYGEPGGLCPQHDRPRLHCWATASAIALDDTDLIDCAASAVMLGTRPPPRSRIMARAAPHLEPMPWMTLTSTTSTRHRHARRFNSRRGTTDDERDALLLRLDKRLEGIDKRLDGIGLRLDQVDGALKALLEGQHSIREVMVRDGAAQVRVNREVADRLDKLEERKAG